MSERPSRLRGAVLWVLSLILMGSAVVHQRTTGPTYPMRGDLTVDGVAHHYKLVRSEETVRAAEVVLPNPDGKVAATVFWKRYPTDAPFAPVAMTASTDAEGASVLTASLPVQPAAGKIEYYVEATTPDGAVRIPPAGGENEILLRYKDPVPDHFLWPHVLLMFFSVLIGMRAGLSALFQRATMRRYAWMALIGMSIGGLVFGPIVQKYAFGAFWTGFPWGYDLTDNKLLIMWLVWLVACLFLPKPGRPQGLGRFAVLAASVVMVVVYIIPHSMRGSELDYSKLEHVDDPKSAIGTGQR